jgi:peroxiredoxin
MRTISGSGFTTVVCLLAAGVCQAGEDKSLTPAEQYQAIEVAQQKAQMDFSRAYHAAKTDEEREKVKALIDPATYAPQMLALLREHPKDEAALDAFRWLSAFYDSGKAYPEAVDLIIRNWIEDKRLAHVFGPLGHARESGRLLLQAAIDKNPDHTVQGCARYDLALSTLLENDWQVNSSSAERQAREKKGEDLLEQVAEKYGDIGWGPSTLGKSAEAVLFERRRLGVGKTAPEIEGEDMEGNAMKLSDTRGKVVLVDFWGTSSLSYMANVPQLQALLKRYENKPFAIVGIDSKEKEDRAAVQKICVEKGMTWRSFWDGDAENSTAEKWNVHEWPTLYLLDAKGIIRYKGRALKSYSSTTNKEGKREQHSGLDDAVDALMKENAAEKP